MSDAITALISGVSGIVIAMIPALIKLKELKNAEKEIQKKKEDSEKEIENNENQSNIKTLVRGLAFGYYVNFLNYVVTELGSGSLTIIRNEKEEIFKTNNIFIKIIIPGNMKESTLRTSQQNVIDGKDEVIIKTPGSSANVRTRNGRVHVFNDDGVPVLHIFDFA